jgi:hypothetical protein
VSTTAATVGDPNHPPFLNGVKFTLTTSKAVDSKEENATWKLEAEDIEAFRNNVRDILIVLHYGITVSVASAE